MQFAGFDINIVLFSSIIILFIITFSLTWAIKSNKHNFLQDIDVFQDKISKIKENIENIEEENNNYIEETQKIYKRIEEVEQEYERRHKEIESSIEAECKIELEKQKQKNQQDMDQFAQSKEILDYFVQLVVQKIQEDSNKYVQ